MRALQLLLRKQSRSDVIPDREPVEVPMAPAAAMAAGAPVSWRLSLGDAELEPPAREPEPVDSPEQSCEAHQRTTRRHPAPRR